MERTTLAWLFLVLVGLVQAQQCPSETIADVNDPCNPEDLAARRQITAAGIPELLSRNFATWEEYVAYAECLYVDDASWFLHSSGVWEPREVVLEYMATGNIHLNGGIFSTVQTVTSVTPTSLNQWVMTTSSVSTLANVYTPGETLDLPGYDDSVWTIDWVPCTPETATQAAKIQHYSLESAMSQNMVAAAFPSIANRCWLIQRDCVDYPQFTDIWDCIEFYRSLGGGCLEKHGKWGDFRGNSANCRGLHLPMLRLRPQVHCAHVGKDPSPFCQDSACNGKFHGTVIHECKNPTWVVNFHNNGGQCTAQ